MVLDATKAELAAVARGRVDHKIVACCAASLRVTIGKNALRLRRNEIPV